MSDNGFSREPMLDMYLFEANQLIEQLEQIIIECEKEKKLGKENINEIFRIMHTIKGSSAMMMFNDISLLAHSLEDLFFYIRENKHVTIDFVELFDLVLAGIDFIKMETSKLENGEEADGLSEDLIERIKVQLDSMKSVSDGALKGSENNSNTSGLDNFTIQEENPMYYISTYKNGNSQDLRKYSVRIFFEEDCQMENIRAYTVCHNIKDLCSEVYYMPEDIMENNDSSDVIRENGFLLCFSTTSEHSEVEKILNETLFMREIEINVVNQYPEEIKVLSGENEAPAAELVKIEKTSDVEEIEAEEVVEAMEKERETKTNKTQSIISVNVSKLDMLMDLVGEIVISEAMVTRNPDLDGLVLDNFNKAARQLRKLTNELQDIVMSIRMVPVSMTFHKMNRIVRDMSKKLSKDVELTILGEDTEVDKNIIDHLSDPLMHLIRNAIDHGLESKEERIKAGKPEEGNIVLEAKNEGSDVWITIKDDGKGLDREKILKKAREQGLINKNESELTDKEIFSYILLPGFSTKEKVSEFSGRGVGMDVVKKNIDSIGGTISIESTQGQGTTIFIKIPLTLAIIDGMEIGIGKAKYTIPTTSIRESFKASEKDVFADSNGNEMILIRGECYPVVRMSRIFNINTEVTSIDDGILIMVEGESKTACLFADKLLGEQQVVVKALPNYIKKVKGIAGCTILGDGSISLIVDINGVFQK